MTSVGPSVPAPVAVVRRPALRATGADAPETRRAFLDGLDLADQLVDEVRIAIGLVGSDDDEPVREDDAELFRLLNRMTQIGMADGPLAQFFHVMCDALRRVAQGGREMWVHGVEEPLLAAGLSHNELLEASAGPAPESQLRRAAATHRGRLVKLLGDGAMFHFARPADAVHCGLELVREVPRTELPPARVAVHAGPLILRDADFFGRTVNVAARLADYARPHEVLVSEAVVERVADDAVDFHRIGPVDLKGVPEPIVVFAASPPRSDLGEEAGGA